MRKRSGWLAATCVIACGLAAPAVASPDRTIGLLAQPSGSSAVNCSPQPTANVAIQALSDASTPYSVPAGGGLITKWQTVTNGGDDLAGTPITFVLARQIGTSRYTIVGADSETLPNPLPMSGVASFTLAKPIPASGGETLGLYLAPATSFDCYWSHADSSMGHPDTIVAAKDNSAPAAGQVLTITGASGGAFSTSGGLALNVAATLAPPAQSVTVKTAAIPAKAKVHNLALLSSTVRNGGPNANPIIYTDHVPSGLTIDDVSAGDGRCHVSGQTVKCTLVGVATGHRASVGITVTPKSTGHFVNHVSAVPAPGTSDLNPSGNSTRATLTVV